MTNRIALHGFDGWLFAHRFLTALDAADATLLPGFDGQAPPVWNRTVDDLSYGLLDRLGGEPVDAVGCSFGAWVLLEAAVKEPSKFRRLVLVSPVGVKLNARDERQFVDLFALSVNDRNGALYSSAAAGPDLAALDDDQLARLATAQEALARYAWEPYMHSRALRHRLHRIGCPTLVVHGGADRFVCSGDYFAQLTALIPGARCEMIDGAGHRVEEEAPDRLADLINRFLTEA